MSTITTTITFLASTSMSTTQGGGRCTGQPCDRAWHTKGHCRSKWGSCGITEGHCNSDSVWCGSDAIGCSCGGNSARRLRGGEVH
jgi:hypothetical protein